MVSNEKLFAIPALINTIDEEDSSIKQGLTTLRQGSFDWFFQFIHLNSEKNKLMLEAQRIFQNLKKEVGATSPEALSEDVFTGIPGVYKNLLALENKMSSQYDQQLEDLHRKLIDLEQRYKDLNSNVIDEMFARARMGLAGIENPNMQDMIDEIEDNLGIGPDDLEGDPELQYGILEGLAADDPVAQKALDDAFHDMMERTQAPTQITWN